MLSQSRNNASSCKLIVPPSLHVAVQTYGDMVQPFQKAMDTSRVFELECRFGQYRKDTNTFDSSVSLEFVEHILGLVTQPNSAWSATPPSSHSSSSHLSSPTPSTTSPIVWHESTDFFYTIQMQNRPVPIRTTVIWHPGAGEPELIHIMKTRGHQTLCCVPTDPHIQIPSGCDLRISLAQEQPVSRQDIPTSVLPTSVFIKQRCSFWYTSTSTTFPCVWRLDITRKWTGASKGEADLARQSSAPVYNVELECVSCPSRAPRYYVFLSMLLKMRDFLPSQSFAWMPLETTK